MLDFTKTKNMCGYKKAINGVKNKQIKKSKQENIFANHMSEKGFIEKKKNLSLQLNSKMKNNLMFKWAKDMNRHFFKEDL